MPFFKRRDICFSFRNTLGGQIAIFAQLAELLLGRGRRLLEFHALSLGGTNARLPLANQVFLRLAFRSQARQFAFANRAALSHSGHLGVNLPQSLARCHHFFFGFAPFRFESLQTRSQILDFVPEVQHPGFFVTQSLFEFVQQSQHVAQLALHRKWTFSALLASGDGHVMKAFARMG